MFHANRTKWFLAIVIVLATSNHESALAKKGGKGGGGGAGGGGGTKSGFVIAPLDDANGIGAQGRAYDVNDLREVVGIVRLPTDEPAAAYWSMTETDGTVTSTLNLLNGGISASSINNFGEIVGQTYDDAGNAVGVYWLTPSSTPIDLPLLPGYNQCRPSAISNSRLICGFVGIKGQGWQQNRAVVWRVNVDNGNVLISDPVELPSGGPGSGASAVADNDASGFAQVVGFQETTQAALRWNVQSLADGTLSVSATPEVLEVGTYATGINNNGLVCGRTEVDAVVWSGAEASLLDRPGKGKRRVSRVWAADIGDSGIIVGDAGSYIDPRACFWNGVNGSLTYLDDFLDPDSGLQGLSTAEAVNAFGDIVGNGWNGAFIAVPTSP